MSTTSSDVGAGTDTCCPVVFNTEHYPEGLNKKFLTETEENLLELFMPKFEDKDRDIYKASRDIVKSFGHLEGLTVMDVGAGTGLFLPLFSKAVGDKGHVHALEISAGFLQHLAKRIKTESIEHNVSLTKATEKSTGLDEKEHAETVDLVFICDVYHHFSYPSLYLHQLHSHMKKGARLVVLDLIRDSSIHTSHDHGWVEAHVRADKPVFRKEIESAGFRHMYEMTFDALHENYVMVFERE